MKTLIRTGLSVSPRIFAAITAERFLPPPPRVEFQGTGFLNATPILDYYIEPRPACLASVPEL